MKHVRKLGILLTLSLTLTACQTMGLGEIKTEGLVDKKALCSLYNPIKWSKKDTRYTQEQVVEANRVWTKLCKK